jgi:hypothetical protein
LGGGEVGIVSSDFHRLTGATAKINSKNTHSNQALYTLFFHRAAAKPIRPLFQTGSEVRLVQNMFSGCLHFDDI